MYKGRRGRCCRTAFLCLIWFRRDPEEAFAYGMEGYDVNACAASDTGTIRWAESVHGRSHEQAELAIFPWLTKKLEYFNKGNGPAVSLIRLKVTAENMRNAKVVTPLAHGNRIIK
jgi:hypothetical protein